MLIVSEIFHSIQGEGPNAGYPCVFLRTAGCNLRCTWCDTPYALEFRQGKKMQVDEIIETIESFGTNHLVITGGEPMIQQKALQEMLEKLKNYYVEIETNGGFESSIDSYVHQYNCSPKLSGSGNKSYELKLLPNEKTWYKFVIGNEKDMKETLEFIEKYKLPKKRIRLMPEGETEAKSKKNSLWLIEACKKYGFIFNPRIHILLYGTKRGV